MGKTKRKRPASDKSLQRYYWSMNQLMKMTGATASQIRWNVSKNRIPYVLVNGEYYISKKSFSEWSIQNPHFPLESEETISEWIRTSFNIIEFAQLLNVNLTTAENILKSADGKRQLRIIWVANHVRITKESLFQWIAISNRSDKNGEESPKNSPDFSKVEKFLTDEQAAYLAGLSVTRIGAIRRKGEFPSLQVTKRIARIPLDSYLPWLYERKKRKQLRKSRQRKSHRKHT